MAETKAKALKQANYKAKLILGSTPDSESRLIDITDLVLEALSDQNIPQNTEDLFDPCDAYGIAHSIIGLWETSSNFMATTPIHSDRDYVFLMQDINRILNASIVNAKQLDAIKSLIQDAFEKHTNDCLRGIDRAIAENM